jgi:hypothetical protein
MTAWSDGMMEGWNNGLEREMGIPNIPVFQYSISLCGRVAPIS